MYFYEKTCVVLNMGSIVIYKLIVTFGAYYYGIKLQVQHFNVVATFVNLFMLIWNLGVAVIWVFRVAGDWG